MKRNLFMIGFIYALVTLGSIAESQLVPPEGGKRTDTTDDLNEMISEINTDIEHYRLQQGWDTTLTQSQLEQARSQAFLEWCQEHHSDNLGSGPKFSDIKNTEVPSNLGVLDLDWRRLLDSSLRFLKNSPRTFSRKPLLLDPAVCWRPQVLLTLWAVGVRF